MVYSNPFQPPMPPQFPMPFPMQMAPTQPMYGQNQGRPPINQEQFRQFAITLNDSSLANFAQIARQQGISEADIQNGIRFIKSL